MRQDVGLVIDILTLVTLASGLYFAILRFGLKRERYTFLRLSMEAQSICESGNMVLVGITIHMENLGDTRINARRQKKKDGSIYSERLDKCQHAGTLKVRAIPQDIEPTYFDWYSLPPLRATTRSVPKDSLVVSEADLEQINYLNEFQDPEKGYEEVDFWLEPHEPYDLTISLWLRPGVYAAKALFLGPLTKHTEEEYWSCCAVFAAGAGASLRTAPATA